MAKIGEIYKIINKQTPTIIIYIGSTITDLKTRWSKHISYSKKHQSSALYKELYINGDLYEIKSICNVRFNDKRELLAREARKIKKYKPLLNIITDYKNLDDGEFTDSDSDCESYLFCREDSEGSIWDDELNNDNNDKNDNKYYVWSCACSGKCCDCKNTNREYKKWHLEYPEMYKHKHTNIPYTYINKELIKREIT